MELIEKYFPELTGDQSEQLQTLAQEVVEWNEKVNLVSRKDTKELIMHHILHSLVIQKYILFAEGTAILDLGTGGGFPGLPLAIANPHCVFMLVDARRKKIMAVNDMIETLQLTNVEARHARAEDLDVQFDFIVSRAVAPLAKLLEWSDALFATEEINARPNGIIALKGGDLENEIKAAGKGTYVEVTPVSKYFTEDYFIDKQIVYAQSRQS